MLSVSFASEQTDFLPSNTSDIIEWLSGVSNSEHRVVSELAFIFCSDQYLLDLNRQFLQREYYTDVIAFDYSTDTVVSGDIFISIDRVRENANAFGASEHDELHRVMLHGLLHLFGYRDETHGAKHEMTVKEDFYLSLRTF